MPSEDENFFDQFDEEEKEASADANFFDQFDEPGQDTELERLSGEGQPFMEGTSSLNKAIAEGFGAPFDLAAAGLRAVGLDSGEAPFGSSESIKRGMRALRIGVDPKAREDQTRAEQIASGAGTTAGAAQSFLIPTTAGLKLVNTTKQALMSTGIGARINAVLQPVARKLKNAPAVFGATEASLVSSAATGRAVAEAAVPGNEAAGITGEIVFSLLNPTVATAKAVKGTLQGGQSTLANFSKAGRMDNAAKILQNLIIETGEDPAAIIKALKTKLPEGVKVTTGVRTGSRAMLRLERAAAAHSAKFDDATKQQLEDSFRATDAAIEKLTAIGSPDTLRQAASLRKAKFDNILSRRLDEALRGATEAAEGIGTKNARDASVSAENILRVANEEMRAVERSLWSKINKNIEIASINLRTAFNAAKSEILPSEKLAFEADIEAFLKNGATVGDLRILRSRLGNAATAARAAKDFDTARILTNLSDSIVDDFMRLPDTVPGLREARAFSRSYNEVFTRGFNSQALGITREGGERIPPEILLDRAFSGGSRARDVKLTALQKAADAPEGNPLLGAGMRNEQENFLNAAAKVVLNKDDTVNPTKLAGFMRANAETLERFPQLRDQLLRGDNAAQLLVNTREAVKRGNSRITRNKLAFERITQSENITADMTRILKGAEPERQLAQLAKIARTGGREHTDGLFTTIMDATIEPLKRQGGHIDYVQLHDKLYKPGFRGGKTLADVMVEQGIMGKKQAKRLKRIVRVMSNIEARANQKFTAGEIDVEVDDLSDLAIRFAGARVASSANAATGGGGGGSSLIIAGAGSKFFRKILEKIPASRTQDMLIKAAQDPEFAELLLKRVKTPKQRVELEKQINAALIQAGIVPKGEDDGE